MLDYRSKGIHRYIFDRICQIHDEILNNDSEYNELEKIPSELFQRISAKLSPEYREILDQYDCSRMKQLHRQDEIVYSQGFMDGVILSYWIEKIRRGEIKSIV